MSLLGVSQLELRFLIGEQLLCRREKNVSMWGVLGRRVLQGNRIGRKDIRRRLK